MIKKCLKCGRILDHSVKFCPDCGAPQKPSLPETGGGCIKKVFDALTSIIHTIVGKIGVKKCAKYGFLALMLVLLIGIISTRSHAKKSCEWAKSHFEDGTMYIYTTDELPGTVTDASDKRSKAYMSLYQDKDSFFITLKDADKNDLSSSGPVEVNATIVYHEGTKKELSQDLAATMTGSMIRLPSTGTGGIQSALEQEDLQSSPLILTFPDGSVYHLTMPGENTYKEIWEAVSDFWYIPTFNDDIYTGKGVNPDLRSYLEEFETELYAEIEKREEMGVTRELLRDLFNPDSNPKLCAMYQKYQEMEELRRKVDADYYAECKSRVDLALIGHGIDQGLEIGQEIGNLFGSDQWDDLF